MFKEFKEFISKGNAIDLAVGVIIGGAFGKIVNSLVDNMIMPLLGLLLGRINLEGLKFILKKAEGDSPELAITYGVFIQNIVNFLIITFVIFLMVKAMNNFRKKEATTDLLPTVDQQLLTEIRDLLKK